MLFRSRAEEALRESESKFRSLAETAACSIYLSDETRFLYVNPASEAISGYTRQELLRMSPFDVIHPDAREKVRQRTLARLRGESFPANVESPIVTKSGQVRWLDFRVAVIPYEGKPAILATAFDITERKRAEQRYRDVLESAVYGIVLVNDKGEITLANQQAERMFCYRREELLGQPVEMLVPERFRGRHKGDRHGYMAKPRMRAMGESSVELAGRRRDGTSFPAEISLTPLEGGEGMEVVCAIQDVTERKRAEEELIRSHADLRALAGRLHSAQEVERTRIARELHDELGQVLTGLKMEVSGIARHLRRDQQELRERAKAASSLIDSSIVSVRKLATELRPGLLDSLGLAAAIEWQVEEFQSHTGIACSVTVLRQKLALKDDRATALFRILQEALTNIARHAHAKHVQVQLARTDGNLVLVVKDDGRGIRPKKRGKPQSLGIVGMQERAQMLGGKMEVSGQPGKGTTVRASLPVKPPPSAGAAV